MTSFFREISRATKTALRGRYQILFAVMLVMLFVGMASIPITVIPGNSVGLQTRIYGIKGVTVLAVLAILAALSLTLQVKVIAEKQKQRRNEKAHAHPGSAALSGLGVLGGIVSSMFATATCGACLGAAFGFLGFSTIILLVTYRWYILAGAALLLLISIYLSSRRLNRGCEVCLVKL
jgi:hypothetical protein